MKNQKLRITNANEHALNALPEVPADQK